MEPKILSLCSQMSTTGPYQEPIKLSSHIHTVFP
jgi:hypothetical protein